ncbi:hypothetical protein AMTRI_Chr07g75640 [Amborella trichopoda]|uniref:Knottin scorpion toxin-like domain-containing protein n=1 Tax=Amborella trichopoda TaxID=13333 RepID=U5D8S6_AMBTC|nr:hypothetical protein AMTR_s00067p00154430 [Amborella trichopoda]
MAETGFGTVKMQFLLSFLLALFIISAVHGVEAQGEGPGYYCIGECSNINNCAVACAKSGYTKGGKCRPSPAPLFLCCCNT